MERVRLSRGDKRHERIAAALGQSGLAATAVLLPARGGRDDHLLGGDSDSRQIIQDRVSEVRTQRRESSQDAERRAAKLRAATAGLFPNSCRRRCGFEPDAAAPARMQDGHWFREDSGDGDAHRVDLLQSRAESVEPRVSGRGARLLPESDREGAAPGAAAGESGELLCGI